MRYCLLSRFQGAWLGSSLGEALATNYLTDRLRIINYHSRRLALRNQIAAAILKSSSLELVPFVSQQQLSTAVLFNHEDPLSLIWLSLILLGHENLKVLQTTFSQAISSTADKQNATASDRDRSQSLENVLLWGYIVALALREKLDIDNPIEQILAGVATAAIFPQELEMVELALKRKLAWDKMVETLLTRADRERSAIALALYCFATAPHDFYLAVSRARSLGYSSIELQLVVSLTATLSGAYNSLVGIPANWRMFGNCNRIYRQEQQTAVDLFNNWLGVYSPQKPDSCNSTVVTAPKLLQPRSSLKIISQTDY